MNEIRWQLYKDPESKCNSYRRGCDDSEGIKFDLSILVPDGA